MKKFMLLIMTAMFFSFGICSNSFAATVGFVNIQEVVNNYPGIKDIAQQIVDKQVSLQKEFNNKSKSLDDKSKIELQNKMNKELADFEDKKMAPVNKNIKEIVLKVAASKGIDSVVNHKVMVVGGEDLTDDVVKSLKK